MKPLQNFLEEPLKYSWKFFETSFSTPLMHSWKLSETSMKQTLNIIETCFQPPSLQTSFYLPWTFLEALSKDPLKLPCTCNNFKSSLKNPLNFFEIPLKYPWNTLHALLNHSFKHPLNFPETSLRRPCKTYKASLKQHFKCQNPNSTTTQLNLT